MRQGMGGNGQERDRIRWNENGVRVAMVGIEEGMGRKESWDR